MRGERKLLRLSFESDFASSPRLFWLPIFPPRPHAQNSDVLFNEIKMKTGNPGTRVIRKKAGGSNKRDDGQNTSLASILHRRTAQDPEPAKSSAHSKQKAKTAAGPDLCEGGSILAGENPVAVATQAARAQADGSPLSAAAPLQDESVDLSDQSTKRKKFKKTRTYRAYEKALLANESLRETATKRNKIPVREKPNPSLFPARIPGG